MRAAFLALVLSVLGSCGDDGGGGDAPDAAVPDKPKAPSENDPAFTITGARTWYLVGNPATPGDDTLALHVAAPAGTTAIDAWLGDEGPFPLVAAAAGGFDLSLDIATRAAGAYTVLLAADDASTAFAKLTVKRSAPYYILVTTDWDFSDPGDPMLSTQDVFHADHPELKITHFVGPYTYTDPVVTPERQSAVTAWLLAQHDQHGDEIGMHIHPYCNFVEAAGLTCVTDQSTVYATDTTGYTIKLEAYGYDNMVTLLNKGNDLFEQHGLPRAKSFCGGGWTAVLDTLKAVETAGFTTEASALNWKRIEEWKGQGTGELYRWLMAHWVTITDTSQPYYPSATDILTDSAPQVPVLEVPHNGLTVDYVDPAELEYLFGANWDGNPVAHPVTLQVGYHPATSFPNGYKVRVDGFLDIVDAHLHSTDKGPVVYATMSEVRQAFPNP